MSNDKPSSEEGGSGARPSSTNPRGVSEIDTDLMLAMERLKALEDALERQLERTRWLTQREASKTDHVLTLASAVEKRAAAEERNALSRDRQTEALLVTQQTLSEFLEEMKDTRAALSAIATSLTAKQVAKDAAKDAIGEVGQEVVTTVVDIHKQAMSDSGDASNVATLKAIETATLAVETVREITNKHPLYDPKKDRDSEPHRRRSRIVDIAHEARGALKEFRRLSSFGKFILLLLFLLGLGVVYEINEYQTHRKEPSSASK